MTYTNPVLLCDYSDPDLIRVGDTFFMTASSFNFTPGLPILASTDLVNWTLVNYAARRIPLALYDTPQHAKGLWAPSIRFHDGTFYIFVATPDEGIMVTQTTDPYGTWSDLHFVWRGKGFEDPCPFWDDDGRVWLVHAYVKSRIGFNSKLGLLALDPLTLQAVGEDRIIFDGTKTQPTIEGPKIYKRNGWYYIFAPAGGVTDGWQTELRSRKIDGGYEERIALVQGAAPTNGPHQGGWVQTIGGQDWFVHFQERGIFGRVVHLQPAAWKDDWLLLGSSVETGTIPGEPYTVCAMPDCAKAAGTTIAPAASATRISANAALDWQWAANADESFAKFHADGAITLFVLDTRANKDGTMPVLWESANVLTQKISREQFVVVASVDARDLPVGARTGIVFLGGEYASVAIERAEDSFALVYFVSVGSGDERRTECVKDRLPLADGVRDVQFRLQFAKQDERTGAVSFSAQADGATWIPADQPFVAEKAHWVGGRFGVYAVGGAKGRVHVRLEICD